MPRWTSVASAAIFGAAVALTSAAGHAQTQSPNQSAPKARPQQAPGKAANITDKKLDATAAAIKQVTVVRQSYEQRIQAAPQPAEKQRLADEGNAALRKAVTDQGLSLDEYDSIVQVAQNDPQVREKIMQRLQAPAR